MSKIFIHLILLSANYNLTAQIFSETTSAHAVHGKGEEGDGLKGYSRYGYGVNAFSLNSWAIYAESVYQDAIVAISENDYSFWGRSKQSHGAYFRGDDGFANIVLGGSNYFGGNDDGVIMSDPDKPGSDIFLVSNDAVIIELDNDSDEAGRFEIWNGSNTRVFTVSEAGNVEVNGTTVHSSDRNKKTNFQLVETADILSRLCAIPIQKWNYKEDAMTHIGPMAQDFYAAFKVGQDDKTICAVDADGVLMAAVQALNQKVEILEQQLKDMRAEILSQKGSSPRVLRKTKF